MRARLSLPDLGSGALLALYVLAGRWGADRLLDAGAERASEGASLYELRFWIVPALLLLTLLRRGRDVALPGLAGCAAASSLFFLYMGLSAFWAPSPEAALGKALDVLLLGLTGAAVYLGVVGPGGRHLRFSFWACMFAVTALLAGFALVKAAAEGPARLAVLGGGPNVFGRMMALFGVASLFFWRRGWGAPCAAAAVVAAMLVVLSGSRGSMLSLAAGLVVFFAIERLDARRLAALGLAAAGAVAGILNFTEVGKTAIAAYDHRVGKLLLEQGYTSGRDDLYLRAYELGCEHPILGAGLAAFPALGLGVYPHNLELEVFSEGGSAGLILLAIPFVLLLKRLRPMGGRADGAAFAGLTVSLAAVQFSGDLFDARAVFVFLLLAFLPKDDPAPAKRRA